MQKVKSIFRRVSIFAFFLVILLANAQAQATIIEYSSRSAFEEAVPSALVQDWDSYAHGTSFPYGTADNQGIEYYATITYPAGFAINGNAMVTTTYLPSTEPNGLGQTLDGFFYPVDTIRFVFPTLIRAFGIDVSTSSTANPAYQATTNLEGVANSYYNPFPGYTAGQFIGFTSSEAFSEVTIALAPGADPYSYTLDTLRYQPVPLPGSLLLLGSGLLGLAGWRRLRKG